MTKPSEPNYQYCLLFCAGKVTNCSSYERADYQFRVCKHYRLVHQYTRTLRQFDKADLEELVKLAGDIS